jgi:hypothetical protein
MIRRNAGLQRKTGRRLLRLALLVSIGACPAQLPAETEWNPPQFDSMNTPAVHVLPAYPLSPEGIAKTVWRSREMPATTQVVQRWLGLVSGNSTPTLSDGQGVYSPSFPTLESGGQIESGQFGTSDSHFPIPLPPSNLLGCQAEQCQDQSLAVGVFASETGVNSVQPASGSRNAEGAGVTGSGVVTAVGTQPAKQSVVERLSDSDSQASPTEQAIDPLDLLNSLDLECSTGECSQGHGFEDRIVLELSDRDAAAETIVESQSRQPEIFRPNRPLAVSPMPTDQGLVSQPSQAGSLPVRMTEPSDSVSTEVVFSVDPAEFSSRRHAIPQAMSIPIEGSTTIDIDSMQRPPLVGMLSNLPKLHPQSEGSELTLKQLIYSESGAGEGVEPASLAGSPNALADCAVDGSMDGSEGLVTDEPAQPEVEIPTTIVESPNVVNIAVKKAVNLKTEKVLLGVSAERGEICQIIQTSDRGYTVIGLDEGATRIALISELNGERHIEIQQVNVSSTAAAGSDLSSIAENIGQSIQQLYPSSTVRITARDQKLIVQGKVDSEQTARKVLGLVRKAALVPVVDELKTY